MPRREIPERDPTPQAPAARAGVALALVDWGGDGPLALFCHANGFCADTLGVVAERLRPRFRVIGFDSRGHGDSDKPTPPTPYAWEEFARDVGAVAEALVRELGVPRVALGLGHSFGGTCVMTAAARRPDLFERVVLIDPVLLPREGVLDGWTPPPGQPNPSAVIARKRAHVFPSREALRQKWRAKGTFGDWDPRVLELYLRHAYADLPDGRIGLRPATRMSPSRTCSRKPGSRFSRQCVPSSAGSRASARYRPGRMASVSTWSPSRCTRPVTTSTAALTAAPPAWKAPGAG